MAKSKLVRITTVPISLEKLLEGQLTFMSRYYDVVAISSGKQDLESLGTKQNVKVHHVEMTRKITPFKDLLAVWRLYSYFIREKPEIVHTHTPKAGTVGMLAAKLARVPYRLHTVAGLPLLETKGFKRKVLMFVEKLTYMCASHVYPNSYGLMEIITNSRLISDEKKLKVIGGGSSNGIDTTVFNPLTLSANEVVELKRSLGIEDNDFVFVYVGRIVSDKGINELVSAFRSLSAEIQNVKLLLVGEEEPDLDPLTNETRLEIQSNPKIVSVGYQQDVRVFFGISDALTFPSYREGFPNVVMQAGAMSLPSIVSNINGCNEIITDGFNGIIVPVKNVDQLLAAMYSLVNNKQLYNVLKSNARPNIVFKYERKQIWEALLQEYKTLKHV